MDHQDISLRRSDDTLIWSMNDIHSSLLKAGLVAGGVGCLYWVPDYDGEYFQVGLVKVTDRFQMDTTVTMLLDVPIDEITKEYTLLGLNTKYMIWIYSGEQHEQILLAQQQGLPYQFRRYNLNNDYPDGYDLYDLYEFDTIRDLREFLQGILTMCHAFHVDPDDIILACPIFQMEGTSTYLAIEGIILPLLPEGPNENFIYPLDNEGVVFPTINIDDNENTDEEEYDNEYDDEYGRQMRAYRDDDDDNYY